MPRRMNNDCGWLLSTVARLVCRVAPDDCRGSAESCSRLSWSPQGVDPNWYTVATGRGSGNDTRPPWKLPPPVPPQGVAPQIKLIFLRKILTCIRHVVYTVSQVLWDALAIAWFFLIFSYYYTNLILGHSLTTTSLPNRVVNKPNLHIQTINNWNSRQVH